MDLARQTLHDVLPKALYHVLETIYLKSVSLPEWYSGLTKPSATDVIATLNLQSTLPPLISILIIYFAILSLYRTTRFFVRSTVFLVKWGAMIGAAGAALGYITNAVVPDAFGAFSRSNTVAWSRRGKPFHSARPRIWESFGQHQRWREEQSGESAYVSDAGRVAREMVEKILDATQQATDPKEWWRTLTEMAAKTVIGREFADPNNRKRSSNVGKGKAKSR